MHAEPIGYTVAEVAQKLRCCKVLVRRNINEGRLYAINLSPSKDRPKWLISQAALDDFLSAQVSGDGASR